MMTPRADRHRFLWGALSPDAPAETTWADLHMAEFREDRRNSFRHGPRRRRFEPNPNRAYFWSKR